MIFHHLSPTPVLFNVKTTRTALSARMCYTTSFRATVEPRDIDIHL